MAVVFAHDQDVQRLALVYLRSVGDTLGLRDWTFEIRSTPPEQEDALATCEPVPGRRLAIFRFCEHFHLLTPAEQRHAVVHEVLHAHFARLCATLETVSVLDLAMADVEYTVDALADVLAPRMPMPIFVSKDRRTAD